MLNISKKEKIEKKKVNKEHAGQGTWILLIPMYIFTIVFVGLPILYLFVLSFMSRAEVWGVDFTFTLDNYKRILEPLYLNTFAESLKLAMTSTVLVILIGYPYGYFMARMNTVWKKRMMLLIMIPFLDQRTDSIVRLDYYVPKQWCAR